MRLLIVVLSLLFTVLMIGFTLTNLASRVTVVVWNTEYPDVRMYMVVILSALFGVIVAGIIAVAEGASIRLANRRLRREIHKLETEVNYLRTQPASGTRPEPDAVQQETRPAGERPPPQDSRTLPSAPVYGAEGEDWPEDDDDDIYSGGRAV